METTASIDVRFEKVHSGVTIAFPNSKLIPYVLEAALASLFVTLLALAVLSNGFDDITRRDSIWAAITLAIGAGLQFHVLLYTRILKGKRCTHCQRRMLDFDQSPYCESCERRYGFSKAEGAARQIIQEHISIWEEKNGQGTSDVPAWPLKTGIEPSSPSSKKQ